MIEARVVADELATQGTVVHEDQNEMYYYHTNDQTVNFTNNGDH